MNFARRRWILIFCAIREDHRILLWRNCRQLKRILLVRGRRGLFYLIFGICNFSMVLKDLSGISLYASITILNLVLSQKWNILWRCLLLSMRIFNIFITVWTMFKSRRIWRKNQLQVKVLPVSEGRWQWKSKKVVSTQTKYVTHA